MCISDSPYLWRRGFRPELTLEMVRRCWSYRSLNRDEWTWALIFLEHGGHRLAAYPRYRKVEPESEPEEGNGEPCLRVRDPSIARLHRPNAGVITAALRSRCVSCGEPCSVTWKRSSSAS